MSDVRQNIAALLSEDGTFEPSEAFRSRSIVQDRSVYERAGADHEDFRAEQAERLTWFKRRDSVMDWTPPWVKWFVGGTLNASYNCLDRHVEAGGGDKVAYHGDDVARGRPLGDVTTLANAEIVAQIHTMVDSGAGAEE